MGEMPRVPIKTRLFEGQVYVQTVKSDGKRFLWIDADTEFTECDEDELMAKARVVAMAIQIALEQVGM